MPEASMVSWFGVTKPALLFQETKVSESLAIVPLWHHTPFADALFPPYPLRNFRKLSYPRDGQDSTLLCEKTRRKCSSLLFLRGKLWLVVFPLRSGIIPAKPYPDVFYALLYQATG